MEKTQYYGPDKIKEVEVLDYTTPSGEGVVKLHFEGESSLDWKVTSRSAFENIVTEDPTDENYIVQQQTKEIARVVTQLLMEYGISYGNVSYVLERIGDNVQDKFQRANNFQWTKDDGHYVSGYDSMGEINLLQVKEVLDNIDADNERKQDTEE